jgi:ABC-type transporter Mla subunit MlaD
MRLHSRHDSLIGALVLAALVAGWQGMMWLKSSDVFRLKRTLPVVIDSSTYLHPGSVVQVSGYTVGRLGKIGPARSGGLRTTIRLTTDLPIHADAALQIHPSSALGTVGALTLDPGSDSAPLITEDQAIASVVEPPSRATLLVDSLTALVTRP